MRPLRSGARLRPPRPVPGRRRSGQCGGLAAQSCSPEYSNGVCTLQAPVCCWSLRGRRNSGPTSPLGQGGVTLRTMEALKAVVKNGRLILNEATDLPEGAEVELAVVGDHDDDAELLEELEASAADEATGNLIDFDAVIARLGSKP